MPKLTDHETYEAVVDYAKYKASSRTWKILILGIMAGAFIGVGYLGAFTLQGMTTSDPMLQKFLFGAIFPVGILLCVFLGGTLFTSDSLGSLPVLEKQMKARTAFKSWGIVLVGNFLGAFLIALIAVGADFFSGGSAITNTTTAAVSGVQPGAKIGFAGIRAALLNFAEHKFDIKWYFALGSGILCNIVVVGAVWMAFSVKSSVAKFFIIWLPITLFALAGFQHIVANFFVFWTWILDSAIHKDAYAHLDILNQVKGEHYTLPEGKQVGEFVYNNFIPTAIGNWLGGAVFIPVPYYLLTKKFCQHDGHDNSFSAIAPESFVHQHTHDENCGCDIKEESSKDSKKSVKAKLINAEHHMVDVIKKDAKAVKTAVVNAEHKVADKLHKKPTSKKVANK